MTRANRISNRSSTNLKTLGLGLAISGATFLVYLLISYLYIDDRDLLFPLDHTERYPLPVDAEESYSVLLRLDSSKSDDPESEYPKNRKLIYVLETALDPKASESEKEPLEETPEYSLGEKLRIVSEHKEFVNMLWEGMESNRRILDQVHRFESIADLDPLSYSLTDRRFDYLAIRNLTRVYNYKALLLVSEKNTTKRW
tara:strand:- start:14 stop:610 length:597 start_codon:yes stop_codon:yes gene_type:complete